MNIFIKITFTLLFYISCMTDGYSQQTGAHYFFEGNEVVFEFDKNTYIQSAFLDTADALVFKDLEITEVLVTDRSNPKLKNGWKMNRVDTDTYQLRKNISEIGIGFTASHKFLINRKYWLTPMNARDGYLKPEEIIENVYKIDAYDAIPSNQGNALFILKGHDRAREVILTGSFNGWQENKLKMRRVQDQWELRLDLPLGRYEYKFIVDGEWTHDTANPFYVKNEHNTLNSVLDLRDVKKVELSGYKKAKQVILSGSFNGWSTKEYLMEYKDGTWYYDLELSSGKYFYKFIVDGNWITDPHNSYIEKDYQGNKNSVLIVH